MIKNKEGGEDLKITVKKSKMIPISLILIILAVIFTIGISDVSAANITNVSSDTNLTSDNSTVNSLVQAADLKNNQSTIKNTSTSKTNQSVNSSKSKTNKSPDPQIYNNGVPVARGSYAAGYVFKTIQDAINAAQSGDTIMLEDGATFYECINVNKALTFDVLNNGHATIDGSSGSRIVNITVTSGTVTFNDITFTHGSITGNGGAIWNNNVGTTLIVNNCNFISNTVTNNNGGAIYSTGPLTVNNSNFTSNRITGTNHDGGAIYSTNTLTVTNSNFTSNTATRNGGAIFSSSTKTATITGNNFVTNSASTNGGAIFTNTAEIHFNRIIGNTPTGSQIRRSGGTVNAQNNWWGSNTTPSGKVSNGPVVTTWLVLTGTASPNTIRTSETSTVTADLTHDNTGTYYDPASGHVPDGIPISFTLNPSTIGSLSSGSDTTSNGNGDTTFIANSNSGTATVTIAVDGVSVAPTITVMRTDVYVSTTGSDTAGDGSQSNPYKTIAKGISMIYPGGTVHIANGTYTGTGNVGITINTNVNIVGESKYLAIIDGQNANRMFTISSGYTVTISSLTLQNGLASNSNGGAIQNSGTLTINNCAFTSNSADANGGAIYNDGTLTVSGSIFTSNVANAYYGGAIYNEGTLTVSGSTFTNNEGYDGGAIAGGTTTVQPSGALTITGSTFTGNTASSAGGAVWTHGTCNITSSTFTGNSANTSGGSTAKGCGGAIRNWGTLTVTGSTFTGNTATTNGAAISNYQGTTTANFNRIIGNGANDINAEYNSGTSTVNAENNWWGSNTGPASARITAATGASVDANPWIILKITASPTSILVGGTSTVTADLTWNSNNVQPTGGHVPDGIPVSFTGTLGSVNPVSASTINGITTTTFTAGYTPGSATVSAAVDGVTVSTPITINPVANLQINQTVNTPVNVGNTVTYTVTVKNNGPNTATNIRIQDLIPAGFTATPSVGTYSGGIWTIPSLANGTTATLTITGTVTSSMAGLTTSNTATELSQTEYTSQLPTSTIGFYTKKANVALTQTTSSTPVNVGDTVTYTVTATNHGPDTATNINIQDIIPSGLTNVVVTPSAGTSYSNGIWTISSLTNGEIATLTIAGKAGADMAGLTTTNTATRTSQTEYNSESATSTSSGIYVKKANVVITNTANSSKLNVGQTGTFTVKVTNNGPDTATNIIINDPLPSGFTASVTGGTYSNGIWAIDSLGSQQSVTLTFTGLITSTMAGTNITNHATETQTEYPPTTISDAIIHVNKADVAINKTINGVSKAIVNVGDTITYIITVINKGADDVTGLQITDLLPSGLSNLAYTASTGTYSLATGLWNIGSLVNGATATLTITGKITSAMAGLNITNYANITAQNEYSSLPVVSAADVYTKKADVTITNTANSSNLNVGQTGTFTVKVTNYGPDTATNIVINDPLPSGFTASVTGGTYSNGVWTITSLASGDSVTLTFTGAITSAMAGTNITNTATETQTEYPQTVTIADAAIHVNKANVIISNTANSSSLNVGQTGTFTVTVTNKGPDTATNIKINDILPSGFTYSTTGGSYDGSVWTIGSLASGSSVTLTFTGVLTAAMAGTNIVNQATETQTEYPFTVTVSDATIHVKKANVALSQTGSYSGNKVTLVVKATNNGPDASTNINIKDIIPTGLTGATVKVSVGTYDSSTGIWTIPSLANGAFATLTITGTAAPQTTVSNNATRTAQDEYNSQTATNIISVYVPQIDIRVLHTPWYYDTATGTYENTYLLSNTPVFMVTAINSGSYDDATGVVIQYVVGDGFEYIGCNTQGVGIATYDSTTRTITWNIDYLPKAGRAFLKVYTKVIKTGTQTPSLTNNALLAHVDQYDVNSANNQASYSIITPKSADIQVKQSYTTYTGSDGKNYVTYTIKVTNNGPDNATGVQITDKLPTGLTYVSNNPSIGTYTSSTGIWNIGSMENGTTQTLTITAIITGTGTIKNNAAKTAQGEDDWNYDDNSQATILIP